MGQIWSSDKKEDEKHGEPAIAAAKPESSTLERPANNTRMPVPPTAGARPGPSPQSNPVGTDIKATASAEHLGEPDDPTNAQNDSQAKAPSKPASTKSSDPTTETSNGGKGAKPPPMPTASSWNLEGIGDWHVKKSPDQRVLQLRKSPSPDTFAGKPRQPTLLLRPIEAQALILQKKSFAISFLLSVQSETEVMCRILDDPFANYLRAMWHPKPGAPREGHLHWLQNDGELGVIRKDTVSKATPAKITLYYGYDPWDKWSLVLFQNGAFVTDMSTSGSVLSVHREPDPAISIVVQVNDAVVGVEISDLVIDAVGGG